MLDVYKYKDHLYSIVGNQSMLKGDDGYWRSCIVYFNICSPNNLYVREKEDFFKKFIKQ